MARLIAVTDTPWSRSKVVLIGVNIWVHTIEDRTSKSSDLNNWLYHVLFLGSLAGHDPVTSCSAGKTSSSALDAVERRFRLRDNRKLAVDHNPDTLHDACKEIPPISSCRRRSSSRLSSLSPPGD